MLAASRANLVIAPLQDVLGLGSEARMNTPGTTAGNWGWRLQTGQTTPELAARLRHLTGEAGRRNDLEGGSTLNEDE
jgi:4-alpha-glucanotransferase